jgi:hypothetical protein
LIELAHLRDISFGLGGMTVVTRVHSLAFSIDATDAGMRDYEIEPGPLMAVTDIGWDGTLYGRWEATGIEAVMTPTPVGKLVERDRGYFCAWRRK